MAYRNYKKKNAYRAKSSQYTETEKLAFKLGCISRGLKNPNSKVFESFSNGINGATSKSNEKPMF